VGYHSPLIIKYMQPLIGDLFTARYDDCIFNDNHFLTLGEDYKYHSKSQLTGWALLWWAVLVWVGREPGQHAKRGPISPFLFLVNSMY
jgi:hypothetical protein